MSLELESIFSIPDQPYHPMYIYIAVHNSVYNRKKWSGYTRLTKKVTVSKGNSLTGNNHLQLMGFPIGKMQPGTEGF